MCNVCAGALKVSWQWMMTNSAVIHSRTCAEDCGNVAGSLRCMASFRCAGALASCAAPLVGLLAERYFGFDGTAARSADGERATSQCAADRLCELSKLLAVYLEKCCCLAVDTNLTKAKALGNALLVFLLVPWTLCFLFYTGEGCQSQFGRRPLIVCKVCASASLCKVWRYV